MVVMAEATEYLPVSGSRMTKNFIHIHTSFNFHNNLLRWVLLLYYLINNEPEAKEIK